MGIINGRKTHLKYNLNNLCNSITNSMAQGNKVNNCYQGHNLLNEILMIERTFSKEIHLIHSWVNEFYPSEIINSLSQPVITLLSSIEALTRLHQEYLEQIERQIDSWVKEIEYSQSNLSFIQYKSLVQPVISFLQVSIYNYYFIFIIYLYFLTFLFYLVLLPFN